jgi:glucose-1-phosphatase
MGLISDDEFIHQIRVLLDNPMVSDIEIINAWNALLLDFFPDSFQLVHRLSVRFPVYLLSNTNYIHIRYIDDILLKERSSLATFFQKAFYSFEMGKRKPNIDIYEELIQSVGLPPDQLIFVDDKLENISTAANLGIKVFHNQYPNAHFKFWEKLNL